MIQRGPVQKDPGGRDNTADLLKGLAVILMVQVHLIELFALPEIYNSATGKFLLFLGGPPAAPIFMAVMGYFVFHSRKPAGVMIIRGLKLIGGGILLNIGLNFHLLISIYNGKFDLNPFIYIFGSDILPLAGFSIIILALLKHYFKNNVYIFGAAGIIVLLAGSLLPDIYTDPVSPAAFIQAFFWGNLEWSYFPLFPWLFYPIAGYLFALLKPFIKNLFSNKTIAYSALGAAVIFLIFTWEYGIEISSTLSVYYHHNIIFAGWTVIFLSCYTAAVYGINKRFRNKSLILFLRWVGINVTAFYVFQWLVIGNIATAIYRTQSGIQLVLWFAAIMISVVLLVILYNYSKERTFPRYIKKTV